MSKQGRHFYEFGPFRIDTVERLLLRGAEVVPLAPKAIETLLALVSNSGHVLEKDRLMKMVWPDTFVEEGGLARNISLLRKALGDGTEDSQYIETIPRRGYRFVALVKEVRDEVATPGVTIPPQEHAGTAPPVPAPTGRLNRTTLAGVALALALIAALAYYGSAGNFREGGGAVKSLAVLPLKSLSNDPAQDYFSEGMTEALITDLAKIGALRVISRTSVMRYKGTQKSLEEIAQELKVDAVVEGTVLQSGERVRITAQLIDARSGRHLWAEIYEHDLRDILALQSKVASAIAREIQVKLTPQEKATLARSRPVDPEAYRAYVYGRYFWNRRTAEGIKRAIEYFGQAIEKDPTYALAHTGLADAYALLGSTAYEVMPPREVMPRAKAAAARALQIDDTLGEAHTSLGYTRLSYDWDWPGAEREFKRAIELSPGYATAHNWYGHYLMAMGRLEEALEEMKRAQDLDPLSPIIGVSLGWCLYHARQYDQAIVQYRRTIDLDPDFVPAHYTLGLAYLKKGQYQEAIRALQQAVTLSGGNPFTLGALGHGYAVAGRKQEAQKELEKLRVLSKHRYVPALYFGLVYAGLDEKTQAIEWGIKACEERSDYLAYLKVAPSIDNLRQHPRFRELLQRVGLNE